MFVNTPFALIVLRVKSWLDWRAQSEVELAEFLPLLNQANFGLSALLIG